MPPPREPSSDHSFLAQAGMGADAAGDVAQGLAKALMESPFLGVGVVDLAGRIRACNDRMAAMLGHTREELTSLRLEEVVHPEERVASREAVAKVLREDIPHAVVDRRYMHKDGSVVMVRVQVTSLRDARGNPVYLAGLVEDVTERRMARAREERQRERLRLALTAANVGFWDWWVKGNRVVFSEIWKRQLGFEPYELPDEFPTWESRLHPDDREHALEVVRAFSAAPSGYYVNDFRMRHRDGSYRHIRAMGAGERSDDGSIERIYGVHIDMTEEVLARRELALNEALAKAFASRDDADCFNAALAAAAQATGSTRGLLGHVNEAGEMRYPGALLPGEPEGARAGGPAPVLPPPPDPAVPWARALHERATHACNTGGALPLGSVPARRLLGAPIIASGEVIGHLLLADAPVDYTEPDAQVARHAADYMAPLLQARLRRRALEREIAHNRRLDALATFANGAAHDFNNKMQAVLGYAECLRVVLPPDAESQRYLDGIEEAALGTSRLCARMLKFTTISSNVPAPTPVGDALDDLSREFQNDLESCGITLVASHAPGLPRVQLSEADLHLVLRDLLMNAVEAIQERGAPGGLISIEASEAATSASPAVRVRIADNGTGMDPATLDRALEPFFSTKFLGRGLGLPTVHGILRAQGGSISLASRPGEGTTVELLLPAAR